MSGAARVRAFVAVPVEAEVQERLGRVQEALAAQAPHAHIAWSPPEQIHLTLHFLGEVATEDLPELKLALRDACAGTRAMRLSVGRLGAFPDTTRPRVIWTHVCDDCAELNHLQIAVGDAMSGFGSHVERKEFSPHLTLGRVKLRPPRYIAGLPRALGTVRSAEGSAWRVDRVELLRSERYRGGTRYTVLDTVTLGARR
jgi:2'-5' RNA ligase